MRIAPLLASLAFLGGCAAPILYTAPVADSTPLRTREVDRSFDSTWSTLVTRLAERFFVINNIDKASGLINVSYTGDPSTYVDCGSVLLNGQRHSAAAPRLVYRADGPLGPPTTVERTLTLDGRINVVVQSAAANRTRISVSSKYVLRRDAVSRNTLSGVLVGSNTATAHFTSATSGSFPAIGSTPPVQCAATGQLEAAILAAVE